MITLKLTTYFQIYILGLFLKENIKKSIYLWKIQKLVQIRGYTLGTLFKKKTIQ